MEHRRQEVHRPLLQLCSGIFDHGHGVNGDPQLRLKQGVELHQRDLSGGFPTSATWTPLGILSSESQWRNWGGLLVRWRLVGRGNPPS